MIIIFTFAQIENKKIYGNRNKARNRDCLSGQLDTLSSPDLEKEITNILEGNAQNVVLDGGKLTYISSAGLRLLLILQKKMGQKGGTFVLRNIQDSIMEIFKITGFSSFLTIE